MGNRRKRRKERDASNDECGRPRRGKRRARIAPAEKIYRAARSRANRRMGWTIHLIAYASTLALILVASRSFRVALIGSVWPTSVG